MLGTISWDLYVMRCGLPPGATTIGDDGVEHHDLGSRAEVEAALAATFPGWRSGETGWDSPESAVDIYLAAGDPVGMVSLTPHGNLAPAMEHIFGFAERLGAHVVTDVLVITRDTWDQPWQEYATWRDRALATPIPPPARPNRRWFRRR